MSSTRHFVAHRRRNIWEEVMSTNRRLVAGLTIATTGAVLAAGIILARRNAQSQLALEQGIRTVDPGAGEHRAAARQPGAASPPSAERAAAAGPTNPIADVVTDPTEARTPAQLADPPSPSDAAASAASRKPARAARNAAGPSAPPAADRPALPAAPALEPLIPVPQARLALSFVGADPVAEELWVAAINDPSLPPDARKDLIEDLNEDGFPDPRHITEDDLPLIMNRLELITTLAPESMDDVNAAAFAEAYKDLINMAFRLMDR
jgi:hypothetical protein